MGLDMILYCRSCYDGNLFRSPAIGITAQEYIVIQSDLRRKSSLRTKELSHMRED